MKQQRQIKLSVDYVSVPLQTRPKVEQPRKKTPDCPVPNMIFRATKIMSEATELLTLAFSKRKVLKL